VNDDHLAEVTRRLRARADGILAAAWFMPEATAGYPGIDLAAPAASIASRAACLGAIRGDAAAALFAPINPAGVVAGLDAAWDVTTPAALLEARLDAATGHLADVIGPEPDGIERAIELLAPVALAGPSEGHPVYAGLRALGFPGNPLGDLWRACDLVRERRGDSHRNAWVAAGLDPVEINVMTELWRGVPIGSVTTNQMGWSIEDCEGALERLEDAGMVEGQALTPAGRATRDEIERATDRQEESLAEVLGSDAEELFALLGPWAREVVTSGPRPWERTSG
jgi:DNA-binding MarR family transcriptional regulator